MKLKGNGVLKKIVDALIGRNRVDAYGMDDDDVIQWIRLDCGCNIELQERVGHIWNFTLDFSNCQDHECDEECKNVTK